MIDKDYVMLYQDVNELAANNIAAGVITYIPVVKQSVLVHLNNDADKIADLYKENDTLLGFNKAIIGLDRGTFNAVEQYYTKQINLILQKVIRGSIDSFKGDYTDLINVLNSGNVPESKIILDAMEYIYNSNKELYNIIEPDSKIIHGHDIIYTLEHTIVCPKRVSDKDIDYPIKKDHPVIYNMNYFHGNILTCV